MLCWPEYYLLDLSSLRLSNEKKFQQRHDLKRFISLFCFPFSFPRYGTVLVFTVYLDFICHTAWPLTGKDPTSLDWQEGRKKKTGNQTTTCFRFHVRIRSVDIGRRTWDLSFPA